MTDKICKNISIFNNYFRKSISFLGYLKGITSFWFFASYYVTDGKINKWINCRLWCLWRECVQNFFNIFIVKKSLSVYNCFFVLPQFWFFPWHQSAWNRGTLILGFVRQVSPITKKIKTCKLNIQKGYSPIYRAWLLICQ